MRLSQLAIDDHPISARCFLVSLGSTATVQVKEVSYLGVSGKFCFPIVTRTYPAVG